MKTFKVKIWKRLPTGEVFFTVDNVYYKTGTKGKGLYEYLYGTVYVMVAGANEFRLSPFEKKQYDQIRYQFRMDD